MSSGSFGIDVFVFIEAIVSPPIISVIILYLGLNPFSRFGSVDVGFVLCRARAVGSDGSAMMRRAWRGRISLGCSCTWRYKHGNQRASPQCLKLTLASEHPCWASVTQVVD